MTAKINSTNIVNKLYTIPHLLFHLRREQGVCWADASDSIEIWNISLVILVVKVLPSPLSQSACLSDKSRHHPMSALLRL